MHFEQVWCHNAVCKTRRWRAVCSLCTHFSWKITDFELWHCWPKWAM